MFHILYIYIHGITTEMFMADLYQTENIFPPEFYKTVIAVNNGTL